MRADLTPDQKVLIVLAERKHGPVMMVGEDVHGRLTPEKAVAVLEEYRARRVEP